MCALDSKSRCASAARARGKVLKITGLTVPASSSGQTSRLRDAAMLALFQEYGPMDYQRSSGVFNADYRDFGNYNYGVVAAAAGYTKDQALAAAGAYNATRSNDTSGAYGNSPRNAEYIEKGYDDYVAGKITPNKN